MCDCGPHHLTPFPKWSNYYPLIYSQTPNFESVLFFFFFFFFIFLKSEGSRIGTVAVSSDGAPPQCHVMNRTKHEPPRPALSLSFVEPAVQRLSTKKSKLFFVLFGTALLLCLSPSTSHHVSSSSPVKSSFSPDRTARLRSVSTWLVSVWRTQF